MNENIKNPDKRVGIKIIDHYGRAIDILTDSGPIQLWPGRIITLPQQRLEASLSQLETAGVIFETNYHLPNRITKKEAYTLSELNGWENPKKKLVDGR